MCVDFPEILHSDSEAVLPGNHDFLLLFCAMLHLSPTTARLRYLAIKFLERREENWHVSGLET